MKVIKVAGLGLFLIGFLIFNLSAFFQNYRIEKQIVTDILESKLNRESIRQNIRIITDQIAGRTINTDFEFVNQLNGAFEEVNQQAFSKYSIDDHQIDALVKRSADGDKYQFNLAYLETVFSKDEESSQFKKEAFKNYGSWLHDRSFSSPEEIRNNLKEVSENIRKYEIISAKGYDKYLVKDLVYELTKSANIGPVRDYPLLFLILTYVFCILGSMMYILPKIKDGPPGIKNNGIFHNTMKNVGWLGIVTGTYLILFYIFLYYFPEYMTSWIIMVDPVSEFLKDSPAGRFFLYGFIYTICILVMGVRMLIKYRHSQYQMIRTCSVMFFQTAFAFLIPEILLRLNQPYFDFKNIWPLDYDFFFDNELNTLISNGSVGIFMLAWGIALIIIAVPVLVYFFGKRWYCSWVCGCGGLAETLGDPYRQLSNKTLKAWKLERWMIHSVLVFAIIMTIGTVYTFFTEQSELLGISTYKIRETYGAWIGAGFAGVIGTGFYPLMGNRVWCRFGCPLAAYLGIIQRFKSRFRITTNGGQCISCGNCSTYCEMGIDVRWYAQRGQNIVRSSCVGCGVCSSVCPRGVLNLENADEKDRLNTPALIGNESLQN